MIMVEQLQEILHEIEINDPSSFTFTGKRDIEYHYDLRNDLIHQAVHIAKKLDFKAGYLVHTPVQDIIDNKWDHRWGVVAYIELPTGQISYHIESPDIQYDGHTYEDKHDRIQGFINNNF